MVRRITSRHVRRCCRNRGGLLSKQKLGGNAHNAPPDEQRTFDVTRERGRVCCFCDCWKTDKRLRGNSHISPDEPRTFDVTRERGRVCCCCDCWKTDKRLRGNSRNAPDEPRTFDVDVTRERETRWFGWFSAFGWLREVWPSLSAKQLVKAASEFCCPLSACFLGWKGCTYDVSTRTPAATLRASQKSGLPTRRLGW